jgi:hypothetical protein
LEVDGRQRELHGLLARERLTGADGGLVTVISERTPSPALDAFEHWFPVDEGSRP